MSFHAMYTYNSGQVAMALKSIHILWFVYMYNLATSWMRGGQEVGEMVEEEGDKIDIQQNEGSSREISKLYITVKERKLQKRQLTAPSRAFSLADPS